MKKLLTLFCFFSALALAQPEVAPYGVQYTLPFDLLAADGQLRTGATDGGTDSSCGLNYGGKSTCTNDFAEVSGGSYNLVLTAAEMQGATIQVDINELIDETLQVETCGHASAKWAECEGELSAAAIIAVWDEVIEDTGTTYTARCLLAAVLAYTAGEWTQAGSVITYQDPGGNENRIVGTIQSPGFDTITITCP